MIKIEDKSWYMWQYLWEIHFENGDSFRFDIEETEDLRKIKFRLWALIIAFNQIEGELEDILCDRLWHWREDSTWMIIVWSMGYAQKIRLLESYLLYLDNICNDKKYWKEIKKTINDLKLAWQIRNACVHAHRHTKNKSYVRVKNKCDENWIKITYRNINEKILDEYILFIENIEYELDDLHETLQESFYK